MASIGIIANPASGKDIRRLVSHATVIDNNEKINIVERIVLGAQALGVEKVYMMPDSYNIGYRVADKLISCHELKCEIVVLDMPYFDSMEDTVRAVEYMENNEEIKCIVTLGGDGTNRAVAKSIKNTPLITVSTGTNNVYPVMMEGTIVGMAAAAVSSGKFDEEKFILRDKRIEIYRDNIFIDIALIDAVISTDVFIGSKAIWDMNSIEKIFVTRSHPASIGFSSIVGCKKIIYPEDDFGACVDINLNNNEIMAPIAAGVVEPISVGEPKILSLNDEYEYITERRGTIALDGEREIEYAKDQKFVFKIRRTGPYHVDVIKVLEVAQISGFFTL
ncbi:MAG TPA: ATP-NAD kinase [Tissierellia bacterium]|jgi:predicted polyphosphate/ATP-dependent NAD kinase|nr:ATP-NAD kinase [Tissierellia bacterium]